MWNENEFQNNHPENEIYVECEVTNEKKEENPKHHRRATKLFAKMAAGVMCAALIAAGGYAAGSWNAGKPAAQEQGALIQADGNKDEGNLPNTDAMSTVNFTTGSNIGEGEFTPKEIAALYKSSVVAITSKTTQEVYSMFGRVQEYESEGAGSGIIVAKTDTELIIATNNHVIEGAKALTVCFNDSEEQVYEAYTKGTDSSNDLAVIAIKLADIPEEVLNSLTIAVLGNSDECAIGEQVVAIGNALGYGQSLTVGYISALNRVVTVDDVTYSPLIQTDAAINPGNSGGALFNMRGEVIGINSVKFASTNVEGIGYAIPISKAIPILSSLAERETREMVAEEEQGYMGITGTNVTSSTNYFNMPTGIYVSEVEEGSAADAAGLKPGDIITSFDGISVSSMTQLKNYLQYYKAGEKVELIVRRLSDGTYESKILTITLGQKPASAENGKEEEETGRQDSQNSRNYGYGNGFWDGFGVFPNW